MSLQRLTAIVALVALTGVTTITARADPREDLGRARVCWAALDPECAEEALVTVRAHLAELSPTERLEALRLSAEVALATERTADAHQFLLVVLELDPRFAPSGWSSDWLDALDAARRDAPDRLPPELAVIVPAEVKSKTPVTLEVHADDPSGIASCQAELASGVRLTLMTADGRVFRGEIPGKEARPPELTFFVEASDRAGNVTRWPANATYHRVVVNEPPEPASTPIIEQWWFWTTIGVVVAGTTAALVLTLGDDEGTSTAPGRYGTLHALPELP